MSDEDPNPASLVGVFDVARAPHSARLRHLWARGQGARIAAASPGAGG
jgi:hypothetical protein